MCIRDRPKLIGYEVREYWLRPENNYDIEYDVIREMMDEHTKMIKMCIRDRERRWLRSHVT